ncbi:MULTISPECIES: hypothetical protein [Paenibacillus]|uniref:Sporulation protein Cse60 n=1 Tax=Paenibacillus radicis (ex Xue et al. 2023) TaxID=2972489 RepID=A0ABT1YHI5_9BACL|nr:hypothetical protein [Paenibacillus radicis (ex Xue et al. 2023)]MCR8632636.1 hypothetical protein [Paenibacillus radicis (ex Xue et al. 2023)]
MIQVKEFVDSDTSLAEKKANVFLAELQDEQVINICYGSMTKPTASGMNAQRSTILVTYKTISKQG